MTVINLNPVTFLVRGSWSGQQTRSLTVGQGDSYVSDNNEVNLRVEQGSVGFGIGDTFTFSTTAGTIVGESVTLRETGPSTGLFEADLAQCQQRAHGGQQFVGGALRRSDHGISRLTHGAVQVNRNRLTGNGSQGIHISGHGNANLQKTVEIGKAVLRGNHAELLTSL